MSGGGGKGRGAYLLLVRVLLSESARGQVALVAERAKVMGWIAIKKEARFSMCILDRNWYCCREEQRKFRDAADTHNCLNSMLFSREFPSPMHAGTEEK